MMQLQITEWEKIFVTYIIDNRLIFKISEDLQQTKRLAGTSQERKSRWPINMKSCDTSLITREMKIKITMKCHCTKIFKTLTNILKYLIMSIVKDVKPQELFVHWC